MPLAFLAWEFVSVFFSVSWERQSVVVPFTHISLFPGGVILLSQKNRIRCFRFCLYRPTFCRVPCCSITAHIAFFYKIVLYLLFIEAFNSSPPFYVPIMFSLESLMTALTVLQQSLKDWPDWSRTIWQCSREVQRVCWGDIWLIQSL